MNWKLSSSEGAVLRDMMRECLSYYRVPLCDAQIECVVLIRDWDGEAIKGLIGRGILEDHGTYIDFTEAARKELSDHIELLLKPAVGDGEAHKNPLEAIQGQWQGEEPIEEILEALSDEDIHFPLKPESETACTVIVEKGQAKPESGVSEMGISKVRNDLITSIASYVNLVDKDPDHWQNIISEIDSLVEMAQRYGAQHTFEYQDLMSRIRKVVKLSRATSTELETILNA